MTYPFYPKEPGAHIVKILTMPYGYVAHSHFIKRGSSSNEQRIKCARFYGSLNICIPGCSTEHYNEWRYLLPVWSYRHKQIFVLDYRAVFNADSSLSYGFMNAINRTNQVVGLDVSIQFGDFTLYGDHVCRAVGFKPIVQTNRMINYPDNNIARNVEQLAVFSKPRDTEHIMNGTYVFERVC